MINLRHQKREILMILSNFKTKNRNIGHSYKKKYPKFTKLVVLVGKTSKIKSIYSLVPQIDHHVAL